MVRITFDRLYTYSLLLPRATFSGAIQLTRCSPLFATSLHRIDPRCPIRRCPIRRRPTGAAVEASSLTVSLRSTNTGLHRPAARQGGETRDRIEHRKPHRFRRWHCPHFRMLLSVSSGRPSDSTSAVHAKHRYGSSLPGYGGHVRRRCSGSATPSGAGMDYRRCRPLHGVAVTRSCCVFAFYGTSMPVRTRTFSSVRSSIAECTPSLPVPESFTPP